MYMLINDVSREPSSIYSLISHYHSSKEELTLAPYPFQFMLFIQLVLCQSLATGNAQEKATSDFNTSSGYWLRVSP